MIRPGNLSDLEQVLDVLEQVKQYMLMQGIEQWDQEYPNQAIISTDIQQRQAYIYTEDNELVAYMVLNEEYDLEYNDLEWATPSPFLVIHRLFVKPTAQGKGISSRMIRYAEEYAIANNYASIRFDAYALNDTANAVYLKKGYQLVGTVLFRKGVFNCYEKALN